MALLATLTVSLLAKASYSTHHFRVTRSVDAVMFMAVGSMQRHAGYMSRTGF